MDDDGLLETVETALASSTPARLMFISAHLKP